VIVTIKPDEIGKLSEEELEEVDEAEKKINKYIKNHYYPGDIEFYVSRFSGLLTKPQNEELIRRLNKAGCQKVTITRYKVRAEQDIEMER
jgi:hypothetical protein